MSIARPSPPRRPDIVNHNPIIMAAPTGARRTKADHPGIPITIPETVACAQSCFQAGADAFHLHIRDESGLHSIDPGIYAEALAEMHAAVPDMPVQVTTESGGVFDVRTQMNTLAQLKPAWATLCVREAATDLGLAPRVYDLCRDQGTELQHILFDADDARLLTDWIRLGWIDDLPSVILVLGRYTADMNSDPTTLEPFLASLPNVGKWMLCAFGPNEHTCLVKAASLGGDVRVGFENSFQKADGTPWADMAETIETLTASLRS